MSPPLPQVDGTIRADATISSFSSAQQLINIRKVQGLQVQGSGTLDGQGSVWWTAYKAKQVSSRPLILVVSDCKDSVVSGITLV